MTFSLISASVMTSFSRLRVFLSTFLAPSPRHGATHFLPGKATPPATGAPPLRAVLRTLHAPMSGTPPKDDEDDMTPEEREAWLKSHGIQIETVEDRKAASSGAVAPVVLQLQGADVSGDIDGVELAFVPADSSKPIRSVKLPPGLLQPGSGDAATAFVKPYFASNTASVDAALLKDQASKQFAGGDLKGLDFSKLTTGAMNAVAAEGSVET